MKKPIEILRKQLSLPYPNEEDFPAFAKSFVSSFKRIAKSKGCTDITIKANYFDLYGNFTLPNGQTCAVFTGDWRTGCKVVVRTVKNYKDYIGGCNNMLSMYSADEFNEDFDDFINKNN